MKPTEEIAQLKGAVLHYKQQCRSLANLAMILVWALVGAAVIIICLLIW